MQNRRSKKPSKQDLEQIREQLQALNPHFKKLKVKPYYSRVRAHASIGCRRVYVRASLATIVPRFTQQYLQRLPTAF